MALVKTLLSQGLQNQSPCALLCHALSRPRKYFFSSLFIHKQSYVKQTATTSIAFKQCLHFENIGFMLSR